MADLTETVRQCANAIGVELGWNEKRAAAKR